MKIKIIFLLLMKLFERKVNMLEEFFYEDEKVGKVLIRKSSRASRINLRLTDQNIILTIPSELKTEKGIDFLESQYEWLFTRLKKKNLIVFDESTDFHTFSFNLKIKKSSYSTFHFKLTPNFLTILYPSNMDIHSEKSQTIIRMGIEKAIKLEAKRILPVKLANLASQHHFSYSTVSVRSSKTRWGSCSSNKNINLSYFLMLLPEYLIDYVLLHELCHTKEMNHGPRFWQLMDAITNDQTKKLREKLKKHKTSI